MNIPEGWKQITRETELIEWVCPHGVGHPAPDEYQPNDRRGSQWRVHGCDGCCVKFLGRTQLHDVKNSDGSHLGTLFIKH